MRSRLIFPPPPVDVLATRRVDLRPPLGERPEAGLCWGQPSTFEFGTPDDEPDDEPGFSVHDLEPRILIGVETTRDFGEELAQVTVPVESIKRTLFYCGQTVEKHLDGSTDTTRRFVEFDFAFSTIGQRGEAPPVQEAAPRPSPRIVRGIDLGPFRTVVDLEVQRDRVVALPPLKFRWESHPWGSSPIGSQCPAGSTAWAGGDWVNNDLASIEFWWDGIPLWDGVEDPSLMPAAPPSRHYGTQIWASWMGLQPSWPTVRAVTIDWDPPPGRPVVEGSEAFTAGGSIPVSIFGHAADGPLVCVTSSQHPLIQESSRLFMNGNPPSRQADLKSWDSYTMAFPAKPEGAGVWNPIGYRLTHNTGDHILRISVLYRFSAAMP